MEPSSSGIAEPVAFPGADYSGTGPGSLVKATVISHVDDAIPLGTTSVRVTYRSTSAVDGGQTQVTGAVFIPAGNPPRGGWPIIAFAHATVGFEPECGPSLYPELGGGAASIASFLRQGFAVAAADYQGLGAPGIHPYLDAKTAAFNVIDSVRALRKVSNEISDSWGGFGGSQGGAAIWSANEQAETYAPELHLVGTVSVVPTADQSGFAAAAASQTLSDERLGVYIGILHGLAGARADFPLDEYRRGMVRDQWVILTACLPQFNDVRTVLLHDAPRSDLVPATPEAQQRLLHLLTAMALPMRPASAPMMVIYAGQDEYVEAKSTEAAIDRACALGDRILVDFQPEKSHATVNGNGFDKWLRNRFDGRPAPSNC
jgi:hypothetical protein